MRLAFLMLAFSAAAVSSVHAAEKWQLQYFYDQDDSSLRITDLQFPSPSRGFAVGAITYRSREPKPVRLSTVDGGVNWSLEPQKEPFHSMYFLNEKLGWMVAPNAVWRTEDGGATWQQKKGPRGLVRVYFSDAKRGWGVGAQKGVYETQDGGETWTKVPAAAEPKSTAEYTTYNCIGFATPQLGLITGFSRPPRPADGSRHPDYMDPENPKRELPGMSIMLQTVDGGKTWRHTSSSMFGVITRLRLTPAGQALLLFEFRGGFQYPSEVAYMDARPGRDKIIYRVRDRAVTDMAILPGGTALLAAVETPSNAARSVIPGKIRMLRSKNLADWEEMDVDYRAVAGKVVFATAGTDVWAATDSGMILKLSQ